MRVFTAALSTETNTFEPTPTGLQTFLDRAYYPASTAPEVPNFCSGPMLAARTRSKELGWTLIEGVIASAQPGGITTRVAYEKLRDELLDDLRQALPVDMVVLALHGAMVADGYDDCEGDVLRRVREIVGPDVIVGAELDLHAQLSEEMINQSDILVAYKEYPHTDVIDRGVELVDICAAAAQKKIRITKAACDTQMMVMIRTSQEPGSVLVQRMYELEKMPGVLSVSLVHGFPWGDTAITGTKVLVYTDGNQALGQELANQFAQEVIDIRHQTHAPFPGADEALDLALAAEPGPVVIADISDNPGCGCAGDSTFIVKRMLERGITNAAIGPFWDPVAVRVAFEAGEGAELNMRIGGKMGPTSGDPVDVRVKVKKLVADLKQHGLTGNERTMGDSALIETGGIEFLLVSLRNQALSTTGFDHIGLDLYSKRIIVVKSAQHFYAAFSKVAKTIIYCDTPGSASMHLETLPFGKITRPRWPIDADFTPTPKAIELHTP